MLYLTVLFGTFTLIKAALETPPSIAETFNSSFYAPQIRKNLKFKCTANGNPKPSTTWTFDGSVIRSTDPSTLKWVDAEGTLTINEIKNEDWGTYQCFAENKLGKAMSIPFRLIEATNQPIQEDKGYNITGDRGESIQIPCLIKTTCLPESYCVYKWFYRKNILEADMQVLSVDRIAIDSVGTLHFNYLSDDTGLYTCVVSNEDTNVQVEGSKMELKVTIPSPQVGSRKPRLTFNSKTVTAMVGSTAVIQCVFSGSSGMRIRWFRKYVDKEAVEIMNENTPNPKFKIGDYGRKLIIAQVSEAEEGQYTCTANNGVSQDSLPGGDNLNTADNTLKLQSLPMFIDEESRPMYQTLPQGVDAIFNCNTRSLPNPPRMPKWLKNGDPLPASDKYRFNPEKTQLIIKNVQEPQENPFRALDVGVYICEVQNDLGTIYGFGSLNVVEQITVLRTLPETEYVLPGQVKSIEVDAKTDPELTLSYNWSFTDYENKTTLNHTEMEQSEYFSFNSNNKQINIIAEKLEGSHVYSVLGTYKVVIWHMFESKEIVTTVKTDSAILPPTAHLAQTGFSWWIILIVLFIILLLILLILIFICCCLRGGGGGGTYPVEEKEIKVGYDRERELKEHGFHNLSRSNGVENKAYSNLSLSSMKPVYIDNEEGSMGDYYGGYGTSADSKKDYFDYYANSRQNPVQSSV